MYLSQLLTDHINIYVCWKVPGPSVKIDIVAVGSGGGKQWWEMITLLSQVTGNNNPNDMFYVEAVG